MPRRKGLLPIPVLTDVVLGREVPRPHTKHARELLSADNRVWFAKSTEFIKLHGLRAEVASAMIAGIVGAPVPRGALCNIDGRWWWCSLRVEPADPWMDDLRVANGGDVARLILLDLFIRNEDRHRDNILVSRDARGRPHVVGIDHEQAWVGAPAALGPFDNPDLDKYPESFADYPGVWRSLPRLVPRIAGTPHALWQELADKVAVLVPGTDARVLGTCLQRRAAALPALVDKYRKTIRISL